MKGHGPGLVNPKRVVCAEPSPDVALAIAQSFGFGISIFAGGSGQGAGSGSGATAEGIAQLGERTQSIQLLRDQMYRACEAYANGAITGTTYNLIMSKNNDAMVTLMLGEVAGGAFGRAGAAIGGSASAEGEASVTSLFEALTAVDQAEKEEEAAEEEVEEAEEKLDDKEEAAANDDNESEEEQENNDQEVEEAEDEVAAAQENLRSKREAKNEAKSKAEAEITKVVGAGSITAKPSVGVAQVLKGMQNNFLREDFADEYVAACLIELGLAPASMGHYLSRQGEYRAKARAHFLSNFVKGGPLASKDKYTEYLDFERKLDKFDRYSTLAEHCQERLYDFVKYARNGEVALEHVRIQVDLQRVLQEAQETRKESIEAYEKLIKSCASFKDDETKKKCAQTVSTIVERPGGSIELGIPKIVETPVGKPPYPRVAYDKAKENKSAFDAQNAKLASVTIPTVDESKVSATDAKSLGKKRGELATNNDKLVESAAAQKTKADAEISASRQKIIDDHQNGRPSLATKVEQVRGADEVTRNAAIKTLESHDADSAEYIKKYQDLSEQLENKTVEIKTHLAEIEVFGKQIKTAVEKKQNADSGEN